VAAEKLEIVSQAYTDQLEIMEAANALGAKDVDVILINPNLYQNITTPFLAKVADRRKIPLIAVLLDKVEKNIATIAYGVDQKAAAEKFGDILARVIQGESPGNIPFFNGRNLPYRLLIHKTKAEQLGMTLPASVLQQADRLY